MDENFWPNMAKCIALAVGEVIQQQGPTRRHLPTFSGDRASLRSWLFIIEEEFKTKNITSESKKVEVTTSLLEGTARNWYTKFIIKEGKCPETFDILKSHVLREFLPSNDQFELRQQLYLLQQSSTVESYVEKFRNILVQIIDIDELSLVTFFVQGLQRYVRSELLYRCPTQLGEAVDIALSYERSRKTFDPKVDIRNPFPNSSAKKSLRFRPRNDTVERMELTVSIVGREVTLRRIVGTRRVRRSMLLTTTKRLLVETRETRRVLSNGGCEQNFRNPRRNSSELFARRRKGVDGCTDSQRDAG